MKELNVPYLSIDLNEGVACDLYLLSKTDIKLDINGNPVKIYEGMKIFVWDCDYDDDDKKCILVADGTAELNTIKIGSWSSDKIKWCCKTDKNSFRHEYKDCSKYYEESKRLREIMNNSKNNRDER